MTVTNYHDHVPLHRLNTPQTLYWLFGGDNRRRMASNLAKRYEAGVGICSATLRLIAYVDPHGGVRELQPPHKLYQMHEMSNRPAIAECQCAAFYDPEVQGPWRDRGSDEHHPFCQFDRTAIPVFKHMMSATPGRKVVGLDERSNPIFAKDDRQTVRPDEAIRARIILSR